MALFFWMNEGTNKAAEELEQKIHSGRMDLLSRFSEACRKEFETNLPLQV